MTEPNTESTPFAESQITRDPNWEVLPTEVQRMLATREIVLLDCREPEERQIAAITPSILVPMGETIQRLHEIEDAIEAGHNESACEAPELIVYCHHGRRSFQVTAALREQGIERVRSLAGGIDAWSLLIDTGVARY